MGTMLAHLEELLTEASSHLPDVTTRRAFGSVGFYVDAKMFALAYGRGERLGVKLPAAADFAEAMALDGSEPWAPHGAPMGSWVLLPARFADDLDALGPWVRRAHALVRAAPSEAAPPKRARASTKARPAAAAAERAPGKRTR